MHLGPPVIHCFARMPGRMLPPSGCGNCAPTIWAEAARISTAANRHTMIVFITNSSGGQDFAGALSVLQRRFYGLWFTSRAHGSLGVRGRTPGTRDTLAASD